MPRHRTCLVFVVAALAAVGVAAARPATAAAPVVLRIVFPEGFSARQMADRVAEVRRIAIRKRHVTPRLTGSGYARAAASARPPRAFRPYLKRRTVEGFLFPALYEFTATTSGAGLVERQLAAFERVWRTVDLRPARRRQRTPYDVLIIASMVERETVAPEEGRSSRRSSTTASSAGCRSRSTRRSATASVSPARDRSERSISRATLRTTRAAFKDLPPTPIGNPGLASIRAAARPAPVDYLYYVRKPDGVHHFFTADEAEFCRVARADGYGC